MARIIPSSPIRILLGIFLCLLCNVPLSTADDAIPLYSLKNLEDRPALRDSIRTYIDDKYAELDEESLPRAQALFLDIVTSLHALGYYDAYIERVRPESRPYSFTIYPGSLYSISSVALKRNNDSVPSPEYLQIDKGEPLLAEPVLETQELLTDKEADTGCPYSLTVSHGVILDKNSKTGDVILNVDRGPEAEFGAVSFEGAPSVKETYLRKLVPYKQGDCWQPDRVERLQTAYLKTGLFSSADIIRPEKPEADGSVPLIVQLKERAHRSIKLGTRFYSDEGPGVTAGWRHRNFLGAAEELSVDVTLSFLLQELSTSFAKPFFLNKKNTFRANTSVAREDTDAFEETRLQVGSYIDRAFSKNSTGSAGLALEITRLKDGDEQTTFGLVSVPTSFTQDKRDDSLNPHEGYQWNANATPYFDVLGEAEPFTTLRLGGSTYFDLGNSGFDPVIAVRAAVGSILGTGRDDIPRSKRFFTGGGGSVRGYAHQEVGPDDANGDPLGGRSVVEMSAEFRFKFTNTIGAVAFVDAGNVYENLYPDFKDGLFVGAGIGARYYTGFGPVRFDIGVPVNKRDEADSAFQIYISLGQAF